MSLILYLLGPFAMRDLGYRQVVSQLAGFPALDYSVTNDKRQGKDEDYKYAPKNRTSGSAVIGSLGTEFKTGLVPVKGIVDSTAE